uniref:transglutaminase-like domain-containing protein n=1 Tax=Candidatus Nitrotoga sp. HW29 TaxID=2886963 RepID=UPI002412F17A
MQGADMTLQTKKGNSFDTASLLIGLLRAANIPARYVYGTIQVPADRAMNWVGGVTKPEAAKQLMGQGGIPNIGLTSGGQIKFIKLEHVWVEAFVDYVPSRGAVNNKPNTWVPMDASYKQYTYTQGMDIKGQVPLDAQALIIQAQTGATVDSAGWVQNINGAAIQTALTTYQCSGLIYTDTSIGRKSTIRGVLNDKATKKIRHQLQTGCNGQVITDTSIGCFAANC